MTKEEMIKKLDSLELQLAKKEEQLLEKDFIYEQVSRLMDRICSKTQASKEDTLLLAKKVCLRLFSLLPSLLYCGPFSTDCFTHGAEHWRIRLYDRET